MQNEIEIKIERLQKMLAEHKFGGILINSQHNFAWLSGGKTNGINLSSENGACYLLVRNDGRRFVLANNIEIERMLNEELSVEDFEPVEFSWQEEKASGDFALKKAKSLLNENKNLASDLFLHSETSQIENLIADCRCDLTVPEIERFRQLGKDAGAALGSVIKLISAGETEIEIARKTRNELAKFNINPVVTLVGADERIGKFRHPIPTEKIWKKTVLIVVCAKREGLIASLSRIVCIGEIPAELQHKTEAAAYIFAKILSELKTGKTGAEIYQIAAEAYTEKGFADEINLHHQGGAAGYKTRDWVIHANSKDVIFPNQAFAFNPSITGTKVEETNLLINGEIEILTETPGFPQISVETNGREFNSSGILSL